MPHDVTMPQLGMAQDAGRIVSWLKRPGEAVAKGDALFEVETDKATMEVEAQAAGFLTAVSAEAGQDVPVGQVIARISETAEEDAAPAPDAPPTDTGTEQPQSEDTAKEGAAQTGAELPEGHRITMPQLGMAQDSGILVSWLKTPGDKVAAEDVLFEVETDKSTMEVEAGRAGFLAATLAQPGDDVPVGHPVAILSEAAPAAPVRRTIGSAATPAKAPPAQATSAQPKPAAAPDTSPAPAPHTRPAPAKAPPPPAVAAGGRILASPKARRLALEQGLDLSLLAAAGHPQPYHAADIETLRALHGSQAAGPVPAANDAPAARRLTATCAEDGTLALVAWFAGARGLSDADAILAGLAGASLGTGETCHVAVERLGTTRGYAVPLDRRLSCVAPSDAAPDLLVRDLRASPLREVVIGAEDVPVLTILSAGPSGSGGLTVTLECAPAQLDAAAALRLITDFAGRMEQPLRHLL